MVFFNTSLPACLISTFVWWSWYFIHCMALTDCLSFGLYPCGGMMPIDFSSKNNFRNTKLQAEAIVMQWANGSIPSSSFLDENVSEFQTTPSQDIHVRSAIFGDLFLEMKCVVFMFIVPRYKFFTILWHHASWIIVLYVGRQSRIVCWFSRLLNRCGKYPLANS